MKKKAKVHRLGTDDDNPVSVPFLSNDKDVIYTHKAGGEFRKLIKIGHFKPQHLYITTDEEIKEGDWCICLDFNRVFHASGEVGREKFLNSRKIIATTDPKLNEINNKNKIDELWFRPLVPKIPQSFMEEYCKAGGIEDVLVEYTTKLVEGTDLGNDCHYVKPDKPKLNPDYTIIIHPVEEKMYSGEEIVKKFKNLIPQLPITQSDMEGMTEDWIIEKLEL